ncbi:MAG: 1-deoxy-D-xylulose-5-phosphate reductoisomerase, partial [candidate division KSB1 bacterium]|nr:1-deoxy-D-xylulose-5-phosphate reductoisomerase [candidate division KSB1 bacterium]
GGTAPAVLNGANEAAVKLFLDRKIRFDQISIGVEEALSRHEVYPNPTIEDILKADNWARDFIKKRFLEN